MTVSSVPREASKLGRSTLLRIIEPRRLAILAQLGIIFLLARAFRLENAAFYSRILPLALAGFVINDLLPLRWRPAFFSALGVFGILIVFGGVAGAWLIGLGLVMIGLCHLPVGFRWRIGIIVAAGAVLMALRYGVAQPPWPGVIWPIFGSIFMFRLAIYLYELKHRGPAPPGMTLAYFFLLPNIVFPLFPIVDFHTFRRTYYDRHPYDVYNDGIRWILRGMTHLVLYRVIYQQVTLSPAAVASTAQIAQYLVGNFGLYLRVSGQFHVAIGILHLFGFRLPETHRFFYLASSFSDVWRRINIYWKDFMQKMVFVPVFLRLRKRGETAALVSATVAVVALTWLLHGYQWFWLLGTWQFNLNDFLFWVLLGLFLLANTLWEQRAGRVRQVAAHGLPASTALARALQTAAVFVLMTILWGFWTSPSVADFAALMRAFTLRPADVGTVAAIVLGVAAVAFVVQRGSFDTPGELGARRWSRHPLLSCALPLAIVWVLGSPRFIPLPSRVQEAFQDTRLAELNKYDLERMQRGYYEALVGGVNRFNSQLWEVYMQRGQSTAWATLSELGAWRSRDDGLRGELRPLVGTVFKGGVFRTNRWGMRDQDYQLRPPPHTLRIAVLGQSHVMGAGVNDGEPFEAVVERHLNADLSPRTGLRYELLNFAVSNYSLMHQALLMEDGRVRSFEPDVILLVSHPADLDGLAAFIFAELSAGRSLDPEADALVREAGITQALPLPEVERRLRPYRSQLARVALARIKANADRSGAVAVYAQIPLPADRPDPEDRSTLLNAAAVSGFVVIDMADVFESRDATALVLDPADHHPNAEGHRVIAARLYSELIQRSIAK